MTVDYKLTHLPSEKLVQILPMKKKQINNKTSFHNSCSVSFHHHTWFLLLMANVVQSLSCVQLIATPWIAAYHASLSFTISWNLLKLRPVEWVILSNHLILCCPHLLVPSIFPSIRVFSNESALCTRWPKYRHFSFSISPSNDYSGLTSFRIDWLDLLAVQGTFKSLLQNHSSKASILWHSGFFMVQLSQYIL